MGKIISTPTDFIRNRKEQNRRSIVKVHHSTISAYNKSVEEARNVYSERNSHTLVSAEKVMFRK
jgi:hypothetical protein